MVYFTYSNGNPSGITFQKEEGTPTISFHVAGEKEPVILITKDWFYWKGERVEDKHNVYEKFNEWLVMASRL